MNETGWSFAHRAHSRDGIHRHCLHFPGKVRRPWEPCGGPPAETCGLGGGRKEPTQGLHHRPVHLSSARGSSHSMAKGTPSPGHHPVGLVLAAGPTSLIPRSGKWRFLDQLKRSFPGLFHFSRPAVSRLCSKEGSKSEKCFRAVPGRDSQASSAFI